jgi:hypothetical protein
MKTLPTDLAGLLCELNSEISNVQQLVLKFSELQDLSLVFLNILVSFLFLVEKTHSVSISIQAEPGLIKKLKEANLTPIVSRLATT